MNNLLVVLPYCKKDVHLAKKLLEWIKTLQDNYASHCQTHSILLAGDSEVPQETRLELKAIAMPLFHHTESIKINVDPSIQSWPKGPNAMFHDASRQIMSCYKLPFLWLEPDAVPLTPDWLERLANEYARCPKRFMGTMATVALNSNLPSKHLSGVAIYPPDAHNLMKLSCASEVGFDYASADVVVSQSRAYDTKLIHELWGSHTEVPSFRDFKRPEDANNIVTPAAIPKDAVLFHRCKDSSLIDLLTLKLGVEKIADQEQIVSDAAEPEPTAPPKRRGRPPIKRLASTAGIL